MKFLVDSTAGALCRWLRILGHDARYVSGAAAGEMLSMARREGRILLSRNRSLSSRDPVAVTGVHADLLEDQLRDLSGTLPLLEEAKPFTRCLVCNGALDFVPPYVFQTQEAFGYCATCDRFYWKATHWEAMRARLGSIFGPGFPEEDVLGEGGHDGE